MQHYMHVRPTIYLDQRIQYNMTRRRWISQGADVCDEVIGLVRLTDKLV